MDSRYVAFFSYTHADDEHDNGLLSNVRARLENEIRLTLGDQRIQVFQDRDDLEPGDVWEARLAKAIDEAVFLIPVITPSFFASEFCCGEFMRFWEKAQADPERARIIPLYWRRHFPLEGAAPTDNEPVLQAVKALQFDDWRDVRQLDITERPLRQKIEAMAEALAERYMRLPSEPAAQEDGEAAVRPFVSVSGNVFTQPTATVNQARLRDPEAERYRAEGRIYIDAPIVESLTGNWFLPGDGNRAYFKDLDAGPEMVVVPSGRFLMGSPDGEGSVDEHPQHEVSIAEPFAVGRYAVTFADWDAAVAAGGVTHSPEANWGRGRQPVINVSWDDATAYCVWLSKATGKAYRLLSEAEWEYCCRAGTTTAFSFGGMLTTHQAQFSEGELGSAKQTVEVGSFPPNEWGFYDMHGNIWEWCKDNWHDGYEGAPNDGLVWKGRNGGRRVVRGGSWFNAPQNLRSAYRNRNTTGYRSLYLGFRVGRTLHP